MEIERVGVVGAGTMGNGIAHVFACGGFPVTLCDLEQRFLDRALATIGNNLEREVAKHKITETEKAAAFGRIETVVDRTKLSTCDLVIEAATEKLAIKAGIFRDLDQLCRPEAILASNTSSISITKLAAPTTRPGKIIGMHFFNPVPVMKLVEVIRGLATAEETFQTVQDLARKLGKTPVEVNDAPGFVSNRVLMPLLNEAMFASPRPRRWTRSSSWAWRIPWARWRWPTSSASTSAWTSCGFCRTASAIPNTALVPC